jgi:hypothetical protein
MNEFQADVASGASNPFPLFYPSSDPRSRSDPSELRRWKDHPMRAGIVLPSNVGGIYAGDMSLLTVWEEIAASRLAVFIHPLTPCGSVRSIPPVIFHFVNDTALAAATIIYSGLLDRFPELNIILGHYDWAIVPGLVAATRVAATRRASSRQQGMIKNGSESAALHKELVIDPHDILLEKPHCGAFHGTDLGLILRLSVVSTASSSLASLPMSVARRLPARPPFAIFVCFFSATELRPSASGMFRQPNYKELHAQRLDCCSLRS